MKYNKLPITNYLLIMFIMRKKVSQLSTMDPRFNQRKGFTLIELLIVIAIAIIIASVAIPIYGNLQVSAQLNESTSLIVQSLRTARVRSISRYNNAPHGVYFDINASADDSFILYQGSSYVARNSAYDITETLDTALSFSSSGFILTGADADVNFSRSLGMPDNTGTITLTHDVKGDRSIILNSIGKVEEE